MGDWCGTAPIRSDDIGAQFTSAWLAPRIAVLSWLVTYASVVRMFAAIAFAQIASLNVAVTIVFTLKAASICLEAPLRAAGSTKTRELSTPSPTLSSPRTPTTPKVPAFAKAAAEAGQNNVKKPDARRVLFAQVEIDGKLTGTPVPIAEVKLYEPSTVKAPPPVSSMLKLAYGLKYEGVWHPKRLWEPLVVDAVTNAMRDAVRSRADEWSLRDVALR